ncbi:anti-sigma factor family protein [Paracoccus spongiarum]|uniref:Anti-sigma factor n=1 Tax=Paracoccus spongiarum TaxID=3064387 RepID=A0ABT9J7Z4_9RHOB|nr:hypothetical protein [Paracoccus sp. 2205BS29-5]MDP5305931.1 hypothetical protein [Paracoccus sp. 2205BS29-5]
MQIDDVTLMALADGELDADEAARLGALVAADPEAQARLRRFTDSRERLKALAAQDGVAAPGDAALIARIRAAAVARVRQTPPPPATPAANRNRAPLAALAAALTAAVVGLGWWQMGADPRGGFAPELAAALDSLPSGEGQMLADGRDLTLIASYRAAGGEFCREFETRQAESIEVVVACRGDGATGAWAQRFATATIAADGFVPASGDLAGLDDFLAELGAGAPLDPDQEAAALASR